MNLIIVGCGRIGSELALAAGAGGHRVTVIDRDGGAFDRLGAEFHGLTMQGNVLDHEVLRRAGIEDADGVAAVTSDDATNFVSARIASQIFHVPNVVARVYDPMRVEAYEAMGIQAVASSSWGARRIEQLLTHPGVILQSGLGHGEIVLVEVRIPSRLAGTKLEDLQPTVPAVVTGLVRGGQAALPDPDEPLERGDLLVLSVRKGDLPQVQAAFAEKQQEG